MDCNLLNVLAFTGLDTSSGSPSRGAADRQSSRGYIGSQVPVILRLTSLETRRGWQRMIFCCSGGHLALQGDFPHG